jgi:serine/threonine protein kinase
VDADERRFGGRADRRDAGGARAGVAAVRAVERRDAEVRSDSGFVDEPPDEEPAVAAGGRIGRFVVLRELGRGAMGVVFAAYDEELDRKVAIKLLHAGRGEQASHGRAMLLREAQAMAKLSHPNVVAVHEVGVIGGAVFVAMEYVAGVDLHQWLTSERRPWRDAVAVLRQAGAGLVAAHREGLVHRDFKPSNVLVGDDGRVRVADFGLAARRSGGTAGPSGLVRVARGAVGDADRRGRADRDAAVHGAGAAARRPRRRRTAISTRSAWRCTRRCTGRGRSTADDAGVS